nr:hypothetical protein [Tanacetum cinerariifolium]
TNAAIPAARRVSAGGVDPAVNVSAGGADPAVIISADGTDPVVIISAGDADSTGTFISVGVSIAIGPSVASAPLSPIRDPAKGKEIAIPSSPVTAPSDKELADQQAAILEAKRQELLEQELKQSLDAEQVYTLEAELKATKILHRDAVVLFAKLIKKLESKLNTKKRKLVLSESEKKEEARQSQELDALLHLANASLHDPTKIIYKRLKKQQSSSGIDFTNAAIPAARRVSAGGVDPAVNVSAGGADPAVIISADGTDPAVVISAGDADSTGTFIFVGVSIAAGPSVASAPLSPIRDPAKGKEIAIPSSPVTAPSDKELADQQAAILEAKRQELLEQELKQSLDAEQVYLDSLLA